MNKKELLAKIADWQKENEILQNKKADLEKKVLSVDIKLNNLMIEYDRLCKKLLGESKEKSDEL
jgi:hypothetical protein